MSGEGAQAPAGGICLDKSSDGIASAAILRNVPDHPMYRSLALVFAVGNSRGKNSKRPIFGRRFRASALSTEALQQQKWRVGCPFSAWPGVAGPWSIRNKDADTRDKPAQDAFTFIRTELEHGLLEIRVSSGPRFRGGDGNLIFRIISGHALGSFRPVISYGVAARTATSGFFAPRPVSMALRTPPEPWAKTAMAMTAIVSDRRSGGDVSSGSHAGLGADAAGRL